jgi:glycosyltransferase involved in cell wall biosynthesis
MSRQTVSVVICAYSLDRWDWLLEAIDSVLRQSVTPDELIVIVDHNTMLYKRLMGQVDQVLVFENSGRRGLSGARNTGVKVSTGDIVAFLDDDARADPQWLDRQLRLYDDAGVLGAGGRIEPLWSSRRPSYFPQELDWIVGCSYRGLPTVAAEVRNVIGASMSFRRVVFDRAGLFDDRIGRTAKPRGAEETDLCVRAAAAVPGGRIVYEPASTVLHHVPAERTSMRYMVARAWGEGVSKALISRPDGSRGLSSERRYLIRVLPRAIGRGLISGSKSGLASSGTIVVVVAATAAGYLVQRARNMRTALWRRALRFRALPTASGELPC